MSAPAAFEITADLVDRSGKTVASAKSQVRVCPAKDARVAVAPDGFLIVDGKPMRRLGVEHTAVVGGDARCYSVACASIVAKVTRDRLMRALSHRHPQYGWERNMGYGTPAHLAGLQAHGACAHHRRSFLPVRQVGMFE